MARTPSGIKVGKAAIYEAAKKLSNWGRWGPDDQIGTLNFITSEDIAGAVAAVGGGHLCVEPGRDEPESVDS